MEVLGGLSVLCVSHERVAGAELAGVSSHLVPLRREEGKQSIAVEVLGLDY